MLVRSVFLALSLVSAVKAQSSFIAQSLFTPQQLEVASFQAPISKNNFTYPQQHTKESAKETLPARAETFLQSEGNASFAYFVDGNQVKSEFTASGKDEKGESCTRDLTPKNFTSLQKIGQTRESIKLYSKIENCEVFVDILADSLKITAGTCPIQQGCKLEMNGLYRKADFSPPSIKVLDREWSEVDKRFNKARVSLTKKLGNTQNMRDFLSEHVDFMTARQMECAPFGREASWCSLRLTQLRTSELEIRLSSLKR